MTRSNALLGYVDALRDELGVDGGSTGIESPASIASILAGTLASSTLAAVAPYPSAYTVFLRVSV
jgi:hypothetical protein